MSIIETRDLVREYHPGRGVSGVTISVESGECFALLGRNGSGKSSLTRLILGLERPSSGMLKVLDYDLRNGSRNHLSKIGFALDRSVHWEDLSGMENAFFFARSHSMPLGDIHGRLKGLFELSDLWERKDDPAKSYSFGMRQKLSIIQALCHDPELLVLDEPSQGLDPHFLQSLRDIVRKRTQEGRTTWIAGNDPDWIAGLTTSIAFMDSGKILARGTEDDLIKEVSSLQKVTINMLHPIGIESPDIKGVRSFEQSDKSIAIILEKDPMLVPAILQWIVSRGGKVSRLGVSQGTLRDAFLLRTGRTLEQ